jgi:hypothetical protein
MKRRSFGLLAGTSVAALKFGLAKAQSANASLLTTTLTPMGAERAGNADGSIPAWTGGYTTIPAGWSPGQSMPDFFAGEQPILTVDSSNMAQYSDRLTDGVKALMTKYGFSIKVYPTHRTASAPQSVYDNIAQNLTRAQLDPGGPNMGFKNAIGGVPFPIPDTSNPLSAGAQIIWNHNSRWAGYGYTATNWAYVVNDGGLVLASKNAITADYPYYNPATSLATFDGIQYRYFDDVTGPANIVGTESLTYSTTDGPTIAWELLNGQGRVRKAPEVSFDTPSSYTDGVSNYDEYFGFTGALLKYDWKYIEKKEMYIPYNNNALVLADPHTAHLAHFLNPDLVRWELHRVWVVEATLHPGERNVLARRKYYVDEDTWIIAHCDAWDANGNLYHINTCYNLLRPDLPGLILANNAVTNLQTGDYATITGNWNEKVNPTLKFYDAIPQANSVFDPESMAASAQY